MSRERELMVAAELLCRDVERIEEVPAWVEHYVHGHYAKRGQWPTHEHLAEQVGRHFRVGDLSVSACLVNIAVADESVRLRTALVGGRRRVTVTARCRVCA